MNIKAIFFILSFLLSFSALAEIALTREFPIPPDIAKKVQFWERIFLTYPSTSTIIHDLDHADLLIDVIDFKKLAEQQNQEKIPENLKRKTIKAYVKRYKLAMKRFKLHHEKALAYGAIEERIWKVYAQDPETLKDLYRGKTRIRSQNGLAEVFIKATERAEFYLPYMEAVFREHKVPTVITRLPFVESMFNLKARSKQGALGIWQFMRSTAKEFLIVNRLVDERLSPFKATKAAAEYLENAYSRLKSWPLSVVGYNYGVNGMMKAINTLKTRDIEIIIGNYKTAAFQYASKNFYAEFIAAVLVYNYLLEKKIIKEPSKNNTVKSFILTKKLSATELIKTSGVSKAIFRKYNPCIKDIAFTHFKNKKLPTPFEVFLPAHLLRSAERKMNKAYSLSTIKGYSTP